MGFLLSRVTRSASMHTSMSQGLPARNLPGDASPWRWDAGGRAKAVSSTADPR